MAKSAKKPSTGKSAASSRKRLNPKKEATAPIGLRSGTKQSAAIEMLRSRDGASIETLTKATGWQQHSVRGFLAGVVRKRLQLDLESTVVAGVRTYRIKAGRAAGSMKPEPTAQKS